MRLLLLLVLGCSGSDPASTDPGSTDPVSPTDEPVAPVAVRFATYNTSLHRTTQGQLSADLDDPAHFQAKNLAAVLQILRPDVVLLNEVDWDANGDSIRKLQANFLGVSQDGREAIAYPHVYIPPTNTGLSSGIDLNGDGTTATTPGNNPYGDDSFGFGQFPGQYGFAVLSMHPIDTAAIRTFQTTLWQDMPGNLIGPDLLSPEALAVFRLSSKNHADVPIQIGNATVHFLVSHPTPPSFDGPEDKNGRRNHDEIKLWTDYLDGGPDSWHVDDSGVQGGLAGASFVIAGDLNADPVDGDSRDTPIADLLAHPRVNTTLTPSSPGGTEQATRQAGANTNHAGDPALDTADFNDSTVGNLRIDYVLPSADLTLVDAGVFWPAMSDPDFALIGTFPFPISDHRPVWVDLAVPQSN